jgi:uncharacterized protein (DUF1778 family)
MESKTTQIPIRAPHDRREAWNEAAQKAGLTLNAWIVEALDAKLPKKVRDGLAERNNVGRPKKPKERVAKK